MARYDSAGQGATKEERAALNVADEKCGAIDLLRKPRLHHATLVTVNRISTISGVTQSTVSDIVNRNTNKKLCDGFGIGIRDFFDSPLFDDLEQEVK